MTWREEMIIITIEDDKQKAIHGWRDRENAPLAVTPQVDADAPLSPNWVITHVPSGLTLWPNAWPLELAQRVCTALLDLPGWSAPNPMLNRLLRSRAERIVKDLVFGKDRPEVRKQRDRVIGRFRQ